MESTCCNAKPFFAFGFTHGVRMAEDGTYYGVCGDCREHADFETNNKTERTNK